MCDVEPMEVGLVPNSPVVDSFGQLLQVDGAHCLLLEEMNRPLLELVSPISSPNVLNDDSKEVVTVEKNSVVINTPVLANESSEQSEVLIHTVNAEIHSESSEIAKKPKGSVVAKENTRSHSNAPKVASVCKKVNPNQRKKGFASNPMKENSVKHCRKTDEISWEHGDFSVDDIRMQCRSDFRIPLRSRVPNFGRSAMGYRGDDDYYESYDGMYRGYRNMDLSRYGDRPRSHTFIPPRSNRMYGLTPEERKWLDNMPVGWEDK